MINALFTAFALIAAGQTGSSGASGSGADAGMERARVAPAVRPDARPRRAKTPDQPA